MTVEVRVEEVRELRRRLREINKLDFQTIKWTMNGEELSFDKSVLDRWEKVGLNNDGFVTYVIDGDDSSIVTLLISK